MFADEIYILSLSCEDGYNKIYTKTLAFWTSLTAFFNASIYAKLDTDTLICWKDMLTYLNSLDAAKSLYGGKINMNVRVISNKKHRWYDPFFDLKFSHGMSPPSLYWPYAEGPFYFMSGPLAKTIEGLGKSLSQYQNEDVMVGSWMNGLNVELLSIHKDMIFHPIKDLNHHIQLRG